MAQKQAVIVNETNTRIGPALTASRISHIRRFHVVFACWAVVRIAGYSWRNITWELLRTNSPSPDRAALNRAYCAAGGFEELPLCSDDLRRTRQRYSRSSTPNPESRHAAGADSSIFCNIDPELRSSAPRSMSSTKIPPIAAQFLSDLGICRKRPDQGVTSILDLCHSRP